MAADGGVEVALGFTIPTLLVRTKAAGGWVQNRTQENGVMIGRGVGERAASGGMAAVDIWLDANIKAVNMAEYERYRGYLVSDADLAAGGVPAGKK